MTRPQDAATEALAEAWAAAEGHYGEYLKGGHEPVGSKTTEAMLWASYNSRAAVSVAALKSRGYIIRKARKSG